MRALAILLLLASPLGAQSAADQDVLRTVQRTFDAMKARDTVALRAVFDSTGRIVTTTTRNGAPVVRVVPIDRFVASVGAAKEELNERIFNPEVRIDDNLATVWTRYEFHLGGKLSHCGVDAIQLVRTAAGWKIVQIADTQRREGCTGKR